MKIMIIGSGSIGMLTTFYLSKKGHNPILMTNREEQASLIQDKGLHLIHQNQEAEIVTVLAQPFSSLTEQEPIDVAVVAVKSYQVKEVLTELEKIRVSSILFLQNGMGHTDLFPFITIPELSVAVMEHGALRMNDFTVCHTGVGQLRWSYVSKGRNHVSNMFANGHNPLFPIRYEQNWLDMLQRKLVVNACVNPLTAMLRVRNGELITDQHLFQMMRATFEEVITILDVDNREDVWRHVCQVCQNTAQNRSSMLMDIEHNRQTEIDSMLGYLIKKAKQQRQASILTFLFNGIKSIENKVNQEV